MERLTCPAQGYCEMHCEEYGSCFSEPETCGFSKEIQMYEKLRDYETIGLQPEEIRLIIGTFHQSDRTELNELREILRAKHDGRLKILPRECGKMERVTFEGKFCDIAMCLENPCPYSGSCSQKKTWERLKEYEDAGLTPEQVAAMKAELQDERYRHDRQADFTVGQGQKIDRLKALVAAYTKAEKEGRIVVLPCKVDDTVFVQLVGRIFPFDVISINIHGKTPTFKVQHGMHLVWVFGVDDIGKTVFLTREEAEAALEGGAHE